MSRNPPVLVCVGADCRKNKGCSKLVNQLQGDGRAVELVGCQKICDGPVAGVRVDGDLKWFSKVDGKRQRKALDRLLATGKGLKQLSEVRKRRGKLRE